MLKQTPGSNATVVIENIKKKLEEIKERVFPPGMDFEVSYDVSKFLEASIEKVLHTLFEAFILVSLVVFLFFGRFSQYADSNSGGSGFVDRNVLLHADVWNVDQSDHPIRLVLAIGSWSTMQSSS